MDERQPEDEYTDSDEVDDVDRSEVDAVEPGDDQLDELDDDDADADELDDGDTVQDSSATGPSGDIEELVRYVASHLVQNADELTVESELRGGTVYVSLRVPESEMGRVIGREGRTAKAIRTLVSIAGSRQNVHARLDIDG